MRSYIKKEPKLKEYFNGNVFNSDSNELNNHAKLVLGKLNKILSEDITGRLDCVSVKSNFINCLKEMSVSTFNSSYVSILAIMSLSKQEQEVLLRQLDEQLNTNVFADTRIVNKHIINGKLVNEYTYKHHVYEISDIVLFFTMFRLKITRYIDELVTRYLIANKINQNMTASEQKERLEKYLIEIEDSSSDINNYITSEYEKWISKLNPCVIRFCMNVELDFKEQIKTDLINCIVDLDKRKECVLVRYEQSLSGRIRTYELVKRHIV